MRQLVESWITAEKEQYGNSLAQAVRDINEGQRRCLTPSRVSEWRRGRYTPSPLMISKMLLRTLPWALKRAGLVVSAAQLNDLRRCFWVIAEKEGRKSAELL